MTGNFKLGMVAMASLMLALTLSLPAEAQHPKHDQSSQRQSAPRRESSHPQRQEHLYNRENSHPARSYSGRAPSQPSFRPQARPSHPQARQPYPSSREQGYPQNRSQQRVGSYPQSAPVRRPPMNSGPNHAVSPYSQDRSPGGGREVPRPPSASRNPSSFAQEQQRPVAHPPTGPMNRQPGQAQEVPRPPQSNAFTRDVPRPPTAAQRHGGDWLKSHRELPLADQQKALQSDPQFRRLAPQQQQRLENRLQRFNSLPPDEQQRRLNRIETWEHLTPQQKQQARQLATQWQQMPQGRRQAMKSAIGNLRAMPPEQREQELNSDRYRGMFSDQERNMLRETTKLPLAPAQQPNVPRPPQE